MKIKKFLLLILAGIIVIPASAQLIAPFKSESAGIRFVQLPQSDQKFRNLTVKTTQKARAGEDAADATKKVSDAASKIGIEAKDETGMVSDKESTPREHVLIPSIFPADADLLLEVSFHDKTLLKTPDNPIEFYDGAEAEVLVEYKLYSMPDKTLIEEREPVWVAGEGSGTSGPLQSREDLYKDRLRISRGWATDEIMRKYALKHKYVPVEVYTIKKLKGDMDDMQDEAQEKFVHLANSFRKNGETPEYNKEVKECIASWKQMLEEYVPGEDADINDNNVFALYYNLAAAHYLLGELNKADDYADKGIKITELEWKDVTNNKGEVIGRKRAGIVHVTEDVFHNLKADMHAYYEGKEAHNPQFVAMLTDENNMMKMARAVRNAAVNINLSNALGFDTPLDIVTYGFDEMPKNINGKIMDDGTAVANFEIKKNFFGFIQKPKSYKLELVKTDESLTAKQNLSEIMQPPTQYDFTLTTGKKSFIGLPSNINFGKMKSKPKAHSTASTDVMYDYNGNVTISNSTLQDKWAYINLGMVRVNDQDALEVKKTEATAKFDDYEELASTENEIVSIERDRKLGFGAFFSATFDKMAGKTLETEELSNNTDEKLVDLNSIEEIESRDDKGNWTVKRSGDIKIERELMY
ncbi:MAG: hypothetical protein ACQES1_09570 [Bacteroidota bacterium]